MDKSQNGRETNENFSHKSLKVKTENNERKAKQLNNRTKPQYPTRHFSSRISSSLIYQIFSGCADETLIQSSCSVHFSGVMHCALQKNTAIGSVLHVSNRKDVTFFLLITVISMLQVHSSAIMCRTGLI